MFNMWQKIVTMVRKTGDRCIVFDSQTEDAYVVMDFGEYERILENKNINKKVERETGEQIPLQSGRLTVKPNPDTINADFDIPLLEVPEELDDQPQESFSDLGEESIGTPSHFYLEPIE